MESGYYINRAHNYIYVMRFGLFDKQAARNSAPVWQALRQGLDQLGLAHASHDLDADVAVIWSVLWAGRMRANRDIWNRFRNSGRPVIVAEVGALARGQTWKLGINGTGNEAIWGQGLDPDRPGRLGIRLDPWREQGRDIVICLQRSDSHQWRDQPPVAQWLDWTIDQVRDHTSRPITVRCHPRQRISLPYGVNESVCRPVANTHDDFDFDQVLAGAWAVINWNSSPGSQAVIQGIPAFVGPTSLAAPVANLDLAQIETPARPDRSQWLIDVCHTEWTCDEIATGYPLQRLLRSLESL